MSAAAPRPHFRVEQLEDRAVPAAAVDPSRVLVTTATWANGPAVAAVVERSPAITAVTALGFGVYQADLAPGVSLDQGRAALSGVTGVVSVQPDSKLTVNAVPNDPSYADQWGLTVASAPAAWNVSTGTGQTIVAVIDSGVDTAHPDLAANLWRNAREVAGNGRDDDGNGYVDDVNGYDFTANTGTPTDTLGHGTHVAGIIGAVGGNGAGVTGVSWHVRVMALKFMSGADGGYTSNAIRAIDYAIANGAKVINESWGGGPADGALAAATARARAAGAVIVSAAGNAGSNTDASPFYPASYVTQFDNVVSVAATDRTDRLAGYSNFGANTVTLAAPGSSITSTLPNGRYGTKSGTSMAAPFVSGALALLWDQHPTWTYQQVIAKLKASVDVLPALAGKVATGGRIDLAKLLDATTVSPPTVPPPAPTPTPAPSGQAPQVTGALFSGPRAGTFDRVQVTFSTAVDPGTLTGGVGVTGPAGAVGVSFVQAVAGSENTRFNLIFSRTQTAAGTYTVAVGPQVKSAGGVAAAPFSQSATLGTATPTPTPTPTRTYSVSGLPKAIQDQRTTRVELTVPDTFTITGLSVQLNLTHARTSDLQIRLTAPDGRRVVLFNRGSGASLTNALFTDAGAVRPEQPLAGLLGTSARGKWVLEIFDLAAGATGTLSGVSLQFAGSGAQSVAPPDAVSDAMTNGRPDQISGGSVRHR
ncbi:MAG: S8 family serine peptidase [Gemmataceae bacterium]